MLVADFAGFLEGELHEFEAVAFDQTCPAVDGVADELGGCVGPVDVDVVAVLWIVDAICGITASAGRQ